MRRRLQELFDKRGLRPAFTVLDDSGRHPTGVETHSFRNGGVTLIGLHGNPQLRVDELGPPEFKSNERFEKPRSLRLSLPSELHAWDLRAGKPLGKRKELSLTLDPYDPLIFAFSAAPLPELRFSVPSRIARGDTGHLSLAPTAESPAATHVYHVEVLDPTGRLLPHYSGNAIAPGGRAAWRLPLAHNDPAGRWQVRLRDLLSGQTQTAGIDVF